MAPAAPTVRAIDAAGNLSPYSNVASAATQAATLLVFGDSLSSAYGFGPREGWVSLMEERLKQTNQALVEAQTAEFVPHAYTVLLEYIPRLSDSNSKVGL